MMLKGTASRAGYALFLCNLLPAYRALEAGLERYQALAEIAMPELYRSELIERDLAVLAELEPGASQLLPAGIDYGERVASAGATRLIAHAYVRFLGDLSGGRILARRLAKSLGLPAEAMNFHHFAIGQLNLFGLAYRKAIDSLPMSSQDKKTVLDEALIAFSHNIRLSDEVAAALAQNSSFSNK